MTTVTTTPDQDAVVAEIHIAAPPARVFQALIDREQALQWVKNDAYDTVVWDFDARPGGRWHWVVRENDPAAKHAATYKVSEFDHWGEVLEIDPPRLLAYTWFTNFHDPPSIRTVVRWELSPVDGGTHLKVTHSGLAKLPKARADYSQGWPGLLQAIRDFVTK